jgi:hypothetical protein
LTSVHWTPRTAESVLAPEAAVREADWEESQPRCNFVLLAPHVLPEGLTVEHATLRPECPPGRVEGEEADRRPDWSLANRSCFRFEIAGEGRRLRVKEFLYDWAPAAFDHPSLWKSRNRGFEVGHHIGWLGSDFRGRPAASLHVERTMIEIRVVEGEFEGEELRAICRGFEPAFAEARQRIAETPLAELAYQRRHAELVIAVPVGYWKHERTPPDLLATLFAGEAAPAHLPGRAVRPPSRLRYRLDSTFVYGDVLAPQEADFVHVHPDDPGMYIRVLASPAGVPNGIAHPPSLDQQPCSTETLHVGGREVHYAFADERWGPHEVVFQDRGQNVMLLVKPAAWSDRAWFLDLLRDWLQDLDEGR